MIKEFQMKNTLLIIFVALLTLSMLGCAPKPTSVANKFLSAMQENDVETMKSLSTEESAKAIEFIGMIQAESKIFTSFTILGSEVEKDLAKVRYTVELSEDFKNDEDMNKEQVLSLVKREGKWKVHIEKDGMQK